MIGKLYLEFVNNPENGSTFSYQILNNGTPLVYNSGSNSVDKIFTTASNTQKSVGRIALSDSDINLSPTFNGNRTGANDTINDIAYIPGNNNLWIAGRFNDYNGASTNYISRISATGLGQVNLLAINGVVNTLAHFTASNSLYVGGEFTTFQSLAYNRIVKLSSFTNQIDTSFNVGAGFQSVGGSGNPIVNKIVVQPDGKLLVSGNFLKYQTTNTGKLCRINTDGSCDTSFANSLGLLAFGSVGGGPKCMLVDTESFNNILVGGDFNSLGGNTSRKKLIQLQNGGGYNNSWNVGGSGFPSISSVNCLAIDYVNDYIYAGGFFDSYNGSPKSNIVRLVRTTGAISPGFNCTLDGFVTDIVVDSSQNVIISGGFSTCNGVATSRVVKVDTTGTIISSQTAQFDNFINCIEPMGSDYVYGGAFTNIFTNIIASGPDYIAIGSTTSITQQNTYDNLTNYNTNPNIQYNILSNSIEVTYLTDSEDVISYDNIIDIPGYLNIFYNTDQNTVITLTGRPQSLTPVYNPVVFTWTSPDTSLENFKYTFNIKNTITGETIADFSIYPLQDDSGYIDISRILSNYTTVDFNRNGLSYSIASNSYINYDVNIGEQYKLNWVFDTLYTVGTSSALYSNYITLEQTNIQTANVFQVGDQINIISATSGAFANINGLHTVVDVPSLSSIVIDQQSTVGQIGATAFSGSVQYADGRSIRYNNLYSLTNLCAFNGALPWSTFKLWDKDDYLVVDRIGATTSQVKFLTNMPDNFYAVSGAEMWFNYAAYIPFDNSLDVELVVVASNGVTGSNVITTNNTNENIIVNQVPVGPGQLGFFDGIEWYEFYLNANGKASRTYRVYIDNRCTIENYQILFMDRMGSIVNYSFQLRSKEMINVTRDSYKQQYDVYESATSYDNDNSKGGTTIVNVNVQKEYELNTNWMNDEMSVYFEELITSPFTWILIDNEYYSCTIQEKDLEITRQKNKKLLRKTVTVRLSNDNPINI